MKGQLQTGSGLDAAAISQRLGTRVIARRIVYRESTSSTNDIAKQLAEAGEPEGTLVIADEQNAGRGRFGRTWIAPPHSSILMSLILRPELSPHQTNRVAMAVSLGACKGIELVTRLQAQVKWPNDILVNARKCAGILSEAGIEANHVEYIVAGLGINVNFSATGTKGLPDNATTIADELGHSVSREELVRSVVCEIERYYFRLQDGDDLRSEWRTRIITLHKHVRADTGHRIEEGIAEDVDGDGALLLRLADGSLVRLLAGDVTLSGRAKSGG